jgi:hypothetical protein
MTGGVGEDSLVASSGSMGEGVLVEMDGWEGEGGVGTVASAELQAASIWLAAMKMKPIVLP